MASGKYQSSDDPPRGSASNQPLPELFSAAQWSGLARGLNLSPRQVEVARLICRGLTSEQVGQELGISRHTVQMHLKGLFGRLEVNDRLGLLVQLVVAARDGKCLTRRNDV